MDRTVRVGEGFVTVEAVGYNPLTARPEDRRLVEALVSLMDDFERKPVSTTPVEEGNE